MDRVNCIWCPLQSMTNMLYDFVPSLKMGLMKILVIYECTYYDRKYLIIVLVFSFQLIDIAWDIITDFACELLEKEQADEITEILDRKRKETLAQKRSFFVRMVSDPKIYNPAINKAGTPRMSADNYSPIIEGAPTIQTPAKYD